MRNSVKRFKMLGYMGETPLYPGHGNVTTYEYVLNHKRVYQESVQKRSIILTKEKLERLLIM